MSLSPQPPFISQLKLTNVLSFKDETVVLTALNVIIGPNGAGKSNFITALEVLQGAPTSLASKFQHLGGIGPWIRTGEETAKLEAKVSVPGLQEVRYQLSVNSIENQAFVVDERVENWEITKPGASKPFGYFWYENANPMVSVVSADKPTERALRRETLSQKESILSQRRDPEAYPELFSLAEAFESIRVYNQWTIGPRNVLREFQKTELPTTYLAEDGSNAALIISRIRSSKTRAAFIEAVNEILDGGAAVEVDIDQARAQVFLYEGGSEKVSARRLSDGTLRFIFLAAILLQENLPKVIVIEEPELGLHPDMFGAVANLLRQASERTQIIVTTHATDLVNEFSEEPATILVAERLDGSSSLRRLDKNKLAHWLKDYSLGDAWRIGAIGGNRW